MTAKPWPHEWRSGFRLLPVPELGQPALLIYHVGLPYRDGERIVLYGVDTSDAPGKPYATEPSDPRIQPDLDDDGTLGHLKGMVRDAIKTSGRQGADLMAVDYVLEAMDCVPKGGGKSTPGWFDRVTGRCYPAEGTAYVAALDHLAAPSMARKAALDHLKTLGL